MDSIHKVSQNKLHSDEMTGKKKGYAF